MWKKLSDKKPLKNGDCLCLCKGAGNVYMCVMHYLSKGTLIESAITPYRLGDDVWTVVNGTTAHMNNYITHWTELPKIPTIPNRQ